MNGDLRLIKYHGRKNVELRLESEDGKKMSTIELTPEKLGLLLIGNQIKIEVIEK